MASKTTLPFFVCVLLAAALLLFSRCQGGGATADPQQEPMTTQQQIVDVGEFEAAVESDGQLKAVVEMARRDYGAEDIVLAGVVADETGAQLDVGIMSTGDGKEVVVVRHCRNGECISAIQSGGVAEDNPVWTTPDGPIPVRTMQPPFPMRLLDEDDPDGSAVIAPLPAHLQTAARLTGLPQAGKDTSIRTQADTGTRRFRVASAWGTFWAGIRFDGLEATMRTAGFADTATIYNASASNVDAELSTMGPRDALAIFGHGDVSRSRNRCVGQSVAQYYWLSQHYSEEHMLQQLRNNPNRGPGIIFFCGCQTADMLPQFDHPSRITLGFDTSLAQASSAMGSFFKHFTSGKTLGESVEAVNQEFSKHGFRLMVNARAPLGIKLSEVGDFNRDGCTHACETANNGSCDDGGEGADFDTCALGTDCWDCGPRLEPEEEPAEQGSLEACNAIDLVTVTPRESDAQNDADYCSYVHDVSYQGMERLVMYSHRIDTAADGSVYEFWYRNCLGPGCDGAQVVGTTFTCSRRSGSQGVSREDVTEYLVIYRRDDCAWIEKDLVGSGIEMWPLDCPCR